MGLSVVICAKNSERTIEECLESVKKNNPSEIIVIDGDSADRTVEIAKGYTDRIYSAEGKGLAYARQLGAEKAAEEYICYIDSDVILPEGCLHGLLQELKEAGYVGIHAQVICFKNESYWEWAEDHYFRIAFNRQGERYAIPTMAAIFNKDIIMKYRFDLFFTGAGEDADLCYRLRKDGHKFGIASVFVNHQHRPDFKGFVKQKYWYGRGTMRMAWRHKSKSIRFFLGPSLATLYGVFLSLKNKNLKLIPYFLLRGIFGYAGMVRELPILIGNTCKRITRDVRHAA